MLKKTTALTLALSVATLSAVAATADAYKDDKDVVSYGIGYNMGSTLNAGDYPKLNVDAIIHGLKDGVNGKDKAVSTQRLQAAFSKVQAADRERRAALAKKNLQTGQDFLASNAKKPGVKTTKSGLQYKVITAGNGPKPKASDTVVTNYRGMLINGKEFDSSYARKKPVTFAVSQVIPGWSEALQLMPTGSKWQIFIPANLAYGEYTPSKLIPPNSVLIFDIELIKIEPPKPAATKEPKKK